MLVQWRYNRNVAIAGFESNAALAMVWSLSPAVTFDLDLLVQTPQHRLNDAGPAQTRFEDIYYYAAFNSYNARCGWLRVYRPLDVDTVIAQADFLVVGDGLRHEVTAAFPQHEIVASHGDAAGGGFMRRGERVIWVLRHRDFDQQPYRLIYARQFLDRHRDGGQPLSQTELNTILFDMTAALVLRLPPRDPMALRPLMPAGFQPTLDVRPIYWTAGAWPVRQLAGPFYVELVRRWAAAAPAAGEP
jgi:hypothetical protein